MTDKDKDEYEENFRHFFSIHASEDNIRNLYNIALGISNAK